MSYKVITLCFIVSLILLLSSLTLAARPQPAFSDATPTNKLHGDHVKEAAEEVDQTMEGSCDGVREEECLMRRSLVAHTDYIYTQKANP